VELTGHKQAFCLRDTTQMVSGVAGKYHCGNQGISAGWADTYGAELDCQWLDVTAVPGPARSSTARRPWGRRSVADGAGRAAAPLHKRKLRLDGGRGRSCQRRSARR